MKITNKATVTIYVSDDQKKRKLSPGGSCEVKQPIEGIIRITSNVGIVEMTFTEEGCSKIMTGKLQFDPMESENVIVFMED